MIRAVLYAVGQVLGLAALLLGVFVLWGLGWALLVGGVLVTAGSTALEAVSAPSTPRSHSDREGAA